MKNTWKKERLSDIFQIKPPKSEVKNRLGEDDLVSFVPMEDLGILTKDFIASKERCLKEVSGSYTYFSDNDVLLAKITPCFENGKMGIAHNLTNGIGFGSSEYIVFRSCGQIIPDYLFYFLCTEQFREEGRKNMSGAVGHKRVSKEFIENYAIPFPESISEQHRIVAILDKTFSAIDEATFNAEQNLKNTKDFFESYLQRVFKNKGGDWEEKTLGEIAFVKSGGTPSRAKKEYWEGSIAWYSSGELNDLHTNDPERHINELATNNSNAKIFPQGSLLIGMYDTAALKMSITDRDATFNQAIAGVKPNDKIDLIFILHSINSIKSDLLNLRRGVRQKNLSLEKIKNIPILLPILEVQQAIVHKLDTLSVETKKLEALYQAKINKLEELKKSILQDAFAGKLKNANVEIDKKVHA